MSFRKSTINMTKTQSTLRIRRRFDAVMLNPQPLPPDPPPEVRFGLGSIIVVGG
jgi:hypothetical protein